MKTFDFAIIGGDSRQKYLCRILLEAGYFVIFYGIDINISHNRLKQSKYLEEAMCSAKTILAPIPLSRDHNTIVQEKGQPSILMADFTSNLSSAKRLIAGCIPVHLQTLCPCVDLMRIEELAVFNSVATAEGAIAEAILHAPENLHRSQCLILGYGRCAKTLASKLQGLCARVSVAARSSIALTWAEVNGHSPVPWNKLAEQIATYDLIFNTVPSVVLNSALLKRLKKDAMIFDLASAPGGIDQQKAKDLEISFLPCPGLPGKYAPKASAQAIAKYILNN